ncbi:MAG: hypothetical protein QM817_39965 [Archangium sp.]
MRLFALLVLVAAPAFAIDVDGGVGDAKSLYEEGARQYQVEQYDQAIEAFKKSYVLSANPGTLYNIAQAYRFKGEAFCDEALKYFRSYLDQKPKASDREQVEGLITKMKECVERQPPVAALTPPAIVEPPKPEIIAPPAKANEPSRAGPLTLTIGGGVVALAGVVLQTATRVRYGELVQQCPCPRETWLPWQTAESLSWTFIIGGALLAAGGILWWALQ